MALNWPTEARPFLVEMAMGRPETAGTGRASAWVTRLTYAAHRAVSLFIYFQLLPS